MKKIPLSGELGEGKFALVDDDIYELYGHLKWNLSNTGYVQRIVRLGNGKRKNILLHRLVMNAPKGIQVDHINRDKLDNRRENLRLATSSQQQANQTAKGGYSKYKGVFKERSKRCPWFAAIRFEGKTYYLGSFATELEAAKAYNDAAKKLYGEFACLNDIPDEVPDLTSKLREKTSRFKGVHKNEYGRWVAQIHINGKTRHVGVYDTEIEAAKAYNEKAKEVFGEDAYLNPIPEDFVPPKKEKKIRGVFFNKKLNKWQASITHNYKRHYLGLFDSEIEAAAAYNQKALELFGENAVLNDVPEDVVPPKKERKKSSKYRGVLKRPSGKWEACIWYKGKSHHLGYFDSEIEAAKAYNAKALELHGDKAKLNIIPEEEESTE